MRRILLIAAATIGVLGLLIGGLLVYGALHLNSLVKNNRQYLLDRVGDSLGRDVQAQDIQIGLGWGVTLEVSGLQISDNPSFSQLPFLKAKQVSGRVEVLPLISGQILITRLEIREPEIRVMRDRAGHLNVATLGAKEVTSARPPRAGAEHGQGGIGIPIHFLVQSLSLRDGEASYQDAAAAAPIQVGSVSLDVSNVNPTRPFPVKFGLAALGGTRNLSVKGTVGPLIQNGMLDPLAAPFSFSVTAGPILLDRLRNIPELKAKIPEKLSMPDPITVKAKIKGTPLAAGFDVKTDLGGARLVYLGLFNKPAGTRFQISASGFRRDAAMGVSKATVKLADLKASLSDLAISPGAWSAKVDTNRFDLAPIAKMIAKLAKYELSGSGEAHLAVVSAAQEPHAKGTIALTDVGFKVEGTKLPGINALTGNISVDGNSAVLEPTNFNLGSARASLQGQASSLQPLRATYSFNADNFKLAELVLDRPADEQVSQLKANGTVAARVGNTVALTTALTSGAGMVSKVPYRNLALRAAFDGRQVNVSSLTLDAYGGSIGSRADATVASPRSFRATVNLNNVDLQQALSAQKAKAAETVRGLLSGQVIAAGRGSNVEEIKPTLAGNGRIQITRGKLIGVNVVGTAIKKISGIPAVGTLFTPAVMARHPALFESPDTDLKLAQLTYVMTGPRMTSHDISVQSEDYTVSGQGWFDMDRNVDLSMHVLMSRQFSSELQAEKKNVAYLENQSGEIEIPLLINGRLPHPSVQPDVQFLVQRAAGRAVQEQGGRLLKRYLGNKGLGQFFGGGSGGGADSGGSAGPSGNPPSPNPPSSNPLAPFKNLFH
ncbi:MAG TPA: AsmA-like C-terminal region-containing protein [Candidatus Binataceae bacterium]|nr:AsmA-like C-terminal region-containing protein [Candidatus Binataceae bacterium]